MYLIEVGVEPEEWKGSGREWPLYNQEDDMNILLSQQLQEQRQIEEARAEVLIQLLKVQHHHARQLEILNWKVKRITQ